MLRRTIRFLVFTVVCGPSGRVYAETRIAVVDGRRVTLIAGGGRVGTLYGAYDFLYGPGGGEDQPAGDRPLSRLCGRARSAVAPPAADFDYTTCSATFFPIVRCYVPEFDDPGCDRNLRYRRQLQVWATDAERHYQGQLCIGEYYDLSGYRCLPICFMHTMAHDIPYYCQAGARHFHYMHVTTANWGNKTLTNYQRARQLWDVQTDCEALWADYFDRRCGNQCGIVGGLRRRLPGSRKGLT